MKKICKWCGKEFATTKNNKKYCSPECSKKGLRSAQAAWARDKRNKKLKKHCKLCGKEFTVGIRNSVYCSKECASSMNRYNCAMYYYKRGLHRKEPDINDYKPTYGIHYLPLQSREKNKEKTVIVRKVIEKICPICGEQFKALGKQRYCSDFCKTQARRYSIRKAMYRVGVLKTEPVWEDYKKGGRLYVASKNISVKN